MTTSGLEDGELAQALGDGGGLAADLEVVLALEGARQTLTDQVVVVDEEHAGGRFASWLQRPSVSQELLSRQP